MMDADAKLLGEVDSRGALSRQRAASLLPEDWLEANWQKLQLQPGPRERILRQLFQVFEVPSVQIAYSIGDVPPTTIHLEGRRMLAPPVSADRQFAERARKVSVARAILLMLVIGIPLAYLFRGFYFWNVWVGAMVLGLGASAFLADRFVRGWTLRRAGSRRWAMGAAIAAALSAGMALLAEPRLDTAEGHLAVGRLDDARRELDALGKPDAPSHQRVWTALHFAHALQGKTVEDISRDALQLPEGSQERATVNRRLYELTRDRVLRYLEQKDLTAAMAVLATAAPALRQASAGSFSSTEFTELSAHVHDAEYSSCATEVCRWKSAGEAVRDATTPERDQRLARARAALVERFTPAPRPKAQTLEWLRYLDQTVGIVTELGETPTDEALRARAKQAAAWAWNERLSIPFVGSDRAVVAQLLKLESSGATSIVTTSRVGVTLYCSMKGERCTGAYVVGSDKGRRVLNSPALAASTAELLSRALGHPSELPAPPKRVGGKAPTMSTWKDGKVTIVARWNDADLMELRIGDAKP
ncbi:hypothetical protein ACLESO_01250 [Pyxidicoccus sp. 3LG]